MQEFFNRLKYKFYKKLVFPHKIDKNARIYLIGGPEHGNLGDHLISICTKEFVKNFDADFVEIPYSLYYSYKNKLHDNNQTLILLQGGGNFGNEYIGDDDIRLDVIESFKNSNIIIMPQTIFYNSNPDAELRLAKTQKIFSNHSNLTICAREKVSYQKMKEYFPKNEILLVPDIVLSSRISKVNKQQKNVLFLLRHDLEKVDNTNAIAKIEDWAKSNDYNLIFCDTVKDYRVNLLTRDKEIKKIFKLIQKSQLVVTDRLHGMISAYINNVPTIVFPNYNHKIISSFDWIKSGKVKLYDKDINIEDLVNDKQDNNCLKDNFQELENKITSILTKE